MYKVLKPTLAAKTPSTGEASSTNEYNSKIRKNMLNVRNNERRDQRQSILNRNRCMGGETSALKEPNGTTLKGVKSNCSTPTVLSTIRSSIRSIIGGHKPAYDFNKHITAATTSTTQSKPPLANHSTKKETSTNQSVDVNSTYLVNGANSSSSVGNNSKLTTSMPLTSSSNQTTNRRKLLDEYLQKKKEQMMQKMPFTKSKTVAKLPTPANTNTVNKPPPMPTSSTFTFNSANILKANNIGSNLARSQSTTSRKNIPISNVKNTTSATTPTAPKPLAKSQSLYSKETQKPFEKSLRSTGVPKPPLSSSIPKPGVSKLAQTKDYKKDLELITSKIDTSVVISGGCQSICNVTKIDSVMPNSTSSPIKDAVRKMEEKVMGQTPPPAQLVIEVVREPVSAKKSNEEPIRDAAVKKDQTLPQQQQQQPPVRTMTPVKAQVETVPQLTDDYFNSVELNKRDVDYYKSLVDYKTQCLNKLSTEWMQVCRESQVSEDIEGDIRSVCGLAKLLIDERFNQFIDLINQCRQCTASNATNDPKSQAQSSSDQFELQLTVKCSDLQGFWDMVDCQIEDVLFKFSYMQKLKEHNFVKSDELFEKYGKKPVPVSTSTRPATSTKGPNRNYLKTTAKDTERRAKKDDPNTKLTEATEPTVPKKPARPNFAQFRAQMKKQLNANPTDENPVIIDEKNSTPVCRTPKVMNVQLGNTPKQPDLLDSLKKSARRKSRRTIEPFDPFRYNLRSRKSDLISFDSPMNALSRMNPPTLAVMDEETTETFENCPKIKLDLVENKENQPVEKVFSFDLSAPNTWTKFVTTRDSIVNSPPAHKTPRRTSVRDSLAPDYDRKSQLASISNSPLLKMAFISSHSKRISISTLLNK